MANSMINRVSALAGHYQTGHFGIAGQTGVAMTEVTGLCMSQIACWPDTLEAVGQQAAAMAGCSTAPKPRHSTDGDNGSLLRIEPLKWWLFGAEADEVKAEQGNTLDISHSRTHLRITGDEATTLLNRHLPLDLREDSFPVGSVAATAYHHVGVTLWRSEYGYELFLPRGFAVSLWEGLLASAEQFGVEVV